MPLTNILCNLPFTKTKNRALRAILLYRSVFRFPGAGVVPQKCWYRICYPIYCPQKQTISIGSYMGSYIVLSKSISISRRRGHSKEVPVSLHKKKYCIGSFMGISKSISISRRRGPRGNVGSFVQQCEGLSLRRNAPPVFEIDECILFE